MRRKFQYMLYATSAVMLLVSAFAAGRFTTPVDADCPFELERMEIVPGTPTAYHHITGHRAPKHGVAVPLPPRRPQTIVALTGEELLRIYSKPGVLESLEMN